MQTLQSLIYSRIRSIRRALCLPSEERKYDGGRINTINKRPRYRNLEKYFNNGWVLISAAVCAPHKRRKFISIQRYKQALVELVDHTKMFINYLTQNPSKHAYSISGYCIV